MDASRAAWLSRAKRLTRSRNTLRPRGITRVHRERDRARRMTSVSNWSGSATPLRGELWSSRARDWADLMETAMRQLYRAILDRVDIRAGTTLFDAGCG